MLKASFELPVNAAARTIWKLYGSFELRKTWETDLEAYALDGPFAAGVKGRMVLTGMPPIAFTLTRVEPDRFFCDEMVLGGLGALAFGHEISELADNCRSVRHTISFTPAGGVVLKEHHEFFKHVSGDLADVLWRLKTVAEQREQC